MFNGVRGEGIKKFFSGRRGRNLSFASNEPIKIQAGADIVEIAQGAVAKNTDNLIIASLKATIEDLNIQLAVKKDAALQAKLDWATEYLSKFEKEVKTLQEQMAQKDSKIKNLESKVQASVRLTESVESNAKKVKLLTEKFDALKAEKETSEKALKAQVAQTSKKLEESTKIAKQYKTKCGAILNKYIESKANMLGVKPTEITNRLNESYTLTDIDNVCNELLSYNVKMNSLPFGTNRTSKAYVKESTKPVRPSNKEGYDIDDSLLELAGLK